MRYFCSLTAFVVAIASFVLCSEVYAQPVEVASSPEEVDLQLEGRAYTIQEVKILQELEKRQVELDRREKALDLRESLVELAEDRLDVRVGKMAELQISLQELLKNMSDKEEEELMALAKIYEAMKPAAAANVMNRMDHNIVFDLFKRMGRKSIAKIMEKMATGKARLISEMLAEKKDLPPFKQ